ncbi:hypothetical protein K402DRAFT_107572 [Aulographum hederae CBS 113979]|uniref:Uncharacterized protein n=1 Tax=Aulographum hederae CBS 113979 TaxID=1176131 RepID=A0A6G1GWP0_9PEZI|nr:hypothetical protein K402DRAFT_107572 [Aulographum hederae CBS 113979]
MVAGTKLIILRYEDTVTCLFVAGSCYSCNIDSWQRQGAWQRADRWETTHGASTATDTMAGAEQGCTGGDQLAYWLGQADDGGRLRLVVWDRPGRKYLRYVFCLLRCDAFFATCSVHQPRLLLPHHALALSPDSPTHSLDDTTLEGSRGVGRQDVSPSTPPFSRTDQLHRTARRLPRRRRRRQGRGPSILQPSASTKFTLHLHLLHTAPSLFERYSPSFVFCSFFASLASSCILNQLFFVPASRQTKVDPALSATL